MAIGWYPGHMHKARKDITLALQQVDAIIEIVDARLPYSSENPLLNRLIGSKPRLRVLNKADLADPTISAIWLDYFAGVGIECQLMHRDDPTALKKVLRRVTMGLEPRSTRANRIMIVGIPNVGKSTLINLLADRKIAKVGDEPAVTKARQEIQIAENLVLLDTPGILWPKLEDQQAAYRLAATGAIRNTAIELGDVGLFVVEFLLQRYPAYIKQRYQLDPIGIQPLELLEAVGKYRGCLTKQLGPLSLETPTDIPPSIPELESTTADAS